jgi:hypothetical protein
MSYGDPYDYGYMTTEYARNKDIECYNIEAKEREMEITKGIVTKITTTKDQCVRLTVDIDKSFIPEEVNILKWQDQEVVLQGGDNDRG